MISRPLLAALSAAALSVSAQDALETRPVSLQDCIQMALESNLEIRIARYLPEIGELTLKGDYAAWDPNFSASAGRTYRESPGFSGIADFNPPPTVTWAETFTLGLNGLLPTGMSYNFFGNLPRQSGTRGGIEQGFNYTPAAGGSFTQPLLRNLWIDSTRLAIALDKRNLTQSELSVEQQLINTVTAVTLAYHDLIEARENVKVQQTALELSERALMENRKRVEVGAMAPLEEKQAEAQVARSRADLLTARQQFDTAQNALRRLLSDDFATAAQMAFDPTAALQAIPVVFSRTDSWFKGLAGRPDVRQFQIDLEKQDITLKFTRNQLYPQLDLQGGWGLTGFDRDIGPAIGTIRDRDFENWNIGARFTIPLTNRRARTQHQSAKLQKERLLLAYKQLEQNVMVEIENSILVARTALERVDATKAAHEYAMAAWEAEKKKLENGKSTSFVVLQLQRDLITAASQEIQAKSDYNKALARLAQVEGETLRNYGVDLTIR